MLRELLVNMGIDQNAAALGTVWAFIAAWGAASLAAFWIALRQKCR